MTLIFTWLVMFGCELPVILFVAAMICDTILLSVGMMTGVVHRWW